MADDEQAIMFLENIFMKKSYKASEQVSTAIKDSFKRLLSPSLVPEYRNSSKEKSDKEAVPVLPENPRRLLLAAQPGLKATMAIDNLGFETLIRNCFIS